MYFFEVSRVLFFENLNLQTFLSPFYLPPSSFDPCTSANWQFESAVGSALPVLTTLRDILETGDSVRAISGCVSGTMAYGEIMMVIMMIEERKEWKKMAMRRFLSIQIISSVCHESFVCGLALCFAVLPPSFVSLFYPVYSSLSAANDARQGHQVFGGRGASSESRVHGN